MEEQQSSAAAEPASPKQQRATDQDRQRKLQALQMQRERVLSERTSSPHRRSALEMALADIEERLAELGWSIHI